MFRNHAMTAMLSLSSRLLQDLLAVEQEILGDQLHWHPLSAT